MNQQPPINNGAGNSDGLAAAQFDLQRFVTAQNAGQNLLGVPRNVHSIAYEEMKNGQKKGHWYVSWSLQTANTLQTPVFFYELGIWSHWQTPIGCRRPSNDSTRSARIWYIFPQPDVLGGSQMSRQYGLKSRAEAESYLNHPILGKRLRTLVQAAMDSRADMQRLFPSPQFEVDRLKFQACLTLFALIERGSDVFSRALNHFGLEVHAAVLAWFENQPPPAPPIRTQPGTSRAVTQPGSTTTAPVDDDDIYSYGSDLSTDGQWEDMELEEVLDSRYRRNVLQYRVRWKEDPNDKHWYSAKNLRQAPLKMDEFHKAKPNKEGPPMNIDIWRQYYFRGQRPPQHSDNNRPKSDANSVSRAFAMAKRAQARRQQSRRSPTTRR